jgi:adenylate cyclase
VVTIQAIPGMQMPEPPRPNLLSATRACCERLASGAEIAEMLDHLIADLRRFFGIEHAMVLMLDDAAQRLYTVASTGYDISGVGSEIPLGVGIVGVAARERTPIRITHFTSDYIYSRAIQQSSAAAGISGAIETEIPLPGLAEPHSQLAVPIVGGSRLFGIIFAESSEDTRFGYDEEDALATVAAQLGLAFMAMHRAGIADDSPSAQTLTAPPSGSPSVVRHYAGDESIFIDDDYLIKGVAGAIFWKLLREYAGGRRSEFTNKELRLDAGLRLPALSENLEARLILLERRLAERCPFMQIEKTGRGRFRLAVRRPIKLVEMPGGGA